MLINYISSASLSPQIAIANVPLFVRALLELSQHVVLWAIIGIGLITVLMHLIERIFSIETYHKLLITLISGTIKGYGGSIALHHGLSIGGIDINMAVIGAGTFVVGIENAIFGLVSIYALSVVIDKMITAFDRDGRSWREGSPSTCRFPRREHTGCIYSWSSPTVAKPWKGASCTGTKNYSNESPRDGAVFL
jgi:uncharacterized membrane-anchored protein YitT (DUF2179 family)